MRIQSFIGKRVSTAVRLSDVLLRTADGPHGPHKTSIRMT